MLGRGPRGLGAARVDDDHPAAAALELAQPGGEVGDRHQRRRWRPSGWPRRPGSAGCGRGRGSAAAAGGRTSGRPAAARAAGRRRSRCTCCGCGTTSPARCRASASRGCARWGCRGRAPSASRPWSLTAAASRVATRSSASSQPTSRQPSADTSDRPPQPVGVLVQVRQRDALGADVPPRQRVVGVAADVGDPRSAGRVLDGEEQAADRLAQVAHAALLDHGGHPRTAGPWPGLGRFGEPGARCYSWVLPERRSGCTSYAVKRPRIESARVNRPRRAAQRHEPRGTTRGHRYRRGDQEEDHRRVRHCPRATPAPPRSRSRCSATASPPDRAPEAAQARPPHPSWPAAPRRSSSSPSELHAEGRHQPLPLHHRAARPAPMSLPERLPTQVAAPTTSSRRRTTTEQTTPPRSDRGRPARSSVVALGSRQLDHRRRTAGLDRRPAPPRHRSPRTRRPRVIAPRTRKGTP